MKNAFVMGRVAESASSNNLPDTDTPTRWFGAQ